MMQFLCVGDSYLNTENVTEIKFQTTFAVITVKRGSQTTHYHVTDQTEVNRLRTWADATSVAHVQAIYVGMQTK